MNILNEINENYNIEMIAYAGYHMNLKHIWVIWSCLTQFKIYLSILYNTIDLKTEGQLT